MKKFRKVLCGMLAVAMMWNFAACASEKEQENEEDVQEIVAETTTDNADDANEEAVDETGEDELENLKTRFESLPDPKDITDPDVFLDNYDELADIYADATLLIGKSNGNAEVAQFQMEVFTETTEWADYSKTIAEDLPNDEQIEFWERCGKALEKMNDALNTVLGEDAEN